MAEITASAVKALRELTGLPMMDCKKALLETDGDVQKAVDWLREHGKKITEKRSGRATTTGRFAIYTSFDPGVGTMIDLRCESAPVANNEHFIGLGNDMAKQLATGPGAAAPADLLKQPSPSKSGETLQQQFDDLNNRIREVFKLERIVRLDGSCAGYVHHNGAAAAILQVEGGSPELAKDICIHIVAIRPTVVRKEELDPADIERERGILAAAARAEGKPEKIIEKMVEGRLKDFYAERCLLEQPHANQAKYGGKTIGELALEAGMKIVRFVHWELPKE